MNRKITLIADVKTKILQRSAILFYEKNHSFKDALRRQTFFLNNISVNLTPRFDKSCILVSGLDIEGLYYQAEKGSIEITSDNRMDFYVISDKKLFKRKNYHSIYVYKLEKFVELEKINEIFLRFFKFKPYDLASSIKYIFKCHHNKFFPQYYYQSEFTVRYIHYVVSRVDCNFEVRINWMLSIARIGYKIILYIKTLSSKDLFSFFKNNSPYFLVYNAEAYENIFEKDFIILNDFQ